MRKFIRGNKRYYKEKITDLFRELQYFDSWTYKQLYDLSRDICNAKIPMTWVKECAKEVRGY